MCEDCNYDEFGEPTENPEPDQEAMESAVQAGIKWLDENGPENWRSLVNLYILDISSVRRCVLGQVFAKYANNPEHMRTDPFGYETPYYSGYDYAVYTLLNGEFDDTTTGPLGFSGYPDKYSGYDLTPVWQAALSA